MRVVQWAEVRVGPGGDGVNRGGKTSQGHEGAEHEADFQSNVAAEFLEHGIDGQKAFSNGEELREYCECDGLKAQQHEGRSIEQCVRIQNDLAE